MGFMGKPLLIREYYELRLEGYASLYIYSVRTHLNSRKMDFGLFLNSYTVVIIKAKLVGGGDLGRGKEEIPKPMELS